MKAWLKISGLLCIFGFIREIRPSDSFITEYMLDEHHNLTSDQIYREIYPVGTYSHLVQLVIIFLVTDYLRYKPIIILLSISGIVMFSLLLWSKELLSMQIMEADFGFYLAADVAYYTYIYAKVEKKYYQRVTSLTRAADFAGRFVAGFIAQLIIFMGWMDYRQLIYISLASHIVALFWALSLPKVNRSIYFHRKTPLSTHNSTPKRGNAVRLLWRHFRNAYTNTLVLKWSLWYALGSCGYFQVLGYIQVLWNELRPEEATAWNGAVDAGQTLASAICALIAGYVHFEHFQMHANFLTVATLSCLQGGLVLISCILTNISVSYMSFILFIGLYGFTITMVSAQLARQLEEDSFALVFGFNTFIALIVQTLITIAFVSEVGVRLSIIEQYIIYGIYHFIIAILYVILCLTNKSISSSSAQ